VDIAQLALQFSCANPDLTTTIAGSANPANIRSWSKWLQEPLDATLLEEVRRIFQPVKNLGHLEGLPQNN
jgi:aryl-alcohol dehydrogenase-like predicted oxidoreductase